MSENREGRNARNSHEDRMGTNVYSAKDNESMHKSLNGEFILYQILLQQILDGKDSLSSNEKSLLKYFQPNEKPDKETMTEFDTKYQSTKAIYWYTRESCIYRILNKALRTQDTNDIVPFGPFIKDLSTQLSEEHKLFVEKQQTPTIEVYRGQFISKDEINRLKSGQGQLISMNSFLSTSTNRKKALEFAMSKSPPNDTLTSILLEIDVDLRALSKPYADIKHLSAFAEEEEILFMVACVFRIQQINYDQENKLWMAKFVLCSENDPDMKDFTATIQKQLQGQNQFISMGTYLVDTQKFDQAEKHLEKILTNKIINDPIDYAYCHHGLAKVDQKKGNYNSAIENLNISLDYLLESSSSDDHPLISQCYNDLGLLYSNQTTDHEKAFEYFDKALNTKSNISSITYSGLSKIHFNQKNYQLSLEYLQKTLENQSELPQALIASTYIDMGKVYTAMNKQEKASEMFDKANELQLKGLSSDHPDQGYTYNALALMHADQGNEQKALEFIEKAHRLQSETLPNNHPDLAETYQNFGNFYLKQNNFDNALFSYEKVLDNQLKTLAWNHPSVTETYITIGNIHLKKRNYNQTLSYFHKALQSDLERKKSGEASTNISFKTLGDVYFDKYKAYLDKQILNDALDSYLKYLQNELQNKFIQDISFIDLYKLIAQIYYKKRHLDQALFYYNRLLDCHLQKSPVDQSNIDQTYQFIEKVYLKKRHFNQSLAVYNNTKQRQSQDKYQQTDNVHFEKRHFDQALNHFEKLLNEKLMKYSKEDPSLNKFYYILANISYEKQDFDQSLKYFRQLLNNELQEKSFDHLSLENLYKAIATIYFDKNNLNRSLIYLNRLIDCQLQNKPREHPSIDETYTMIGKIYLNKDYFKNSISKRKDDDKLNSYLTNPQFEKYHLDQNLSYFQTFLHRRNRNYSLDDIYTILANISLQRQDFNQALIYFQSLIKNQQQTNPRGNASLVKIYLIMGDIYLKQGYSNHALQTYKQSLNIYQQIDSQNHSLINKIENRIRKIHVPAV